MKRNSIPNGCEDSRWSKWFRIGARSGRRPAAFPLTLVALLVMSVIGSGSANAEEAESLALLGGESHMGPAREAGTFSGRNTTATLRVSGSSSSEGTVTSSPSGINCGYSCSATFNRGSTITLTASPKPGHTFDRWSGCTSSSGTRCSVTLSQYLSSQTVYAYFDEYPTLRVSKSPSSGGTVTSSGLNCGYSCSVDVAPNSSIVLTANASAGYYFDRWSGCSRSSGNSCTVSMLSSDKTVYAYFKRNPTLRVSKSPSSGGRVTGSGIDCGFRCSVDVAPNSEIVLTANPSSGYSFSRWSGCSRSSRNTCTVRFSSSNKSVTANFTRNRNR